MSPAGPPRVCLVYDCLHPWTIGGEERWLRQLADTLVAAGDPVTYLTRRQWSAADAPDLPGVDVVAVSRADGLYDAAGNRRSGPALRFAIGVARHLVRHRRSYDVVHTCAFPFFHLPALRLALLGTGTPVLVDWPEVWTRDYWQTYAGPVRGRVASAVQRLCGWLTPTALVFSVRHAARFASPRARVLRLGGLGPQLPSEAPQLVAPAQPVAVFAGRHIREKRPELLATAVGHARAQVPGLEDLTARLFGDGPQRGEVERAVEHLHLGGVVAVPGFVPAEVLAEAVRSATCLVLPSSREGFGIVVLEAASVGTPVVVVDGPDNAAVELVVPGVNGEVAEDASPAAVAAAIGRVHAAGSALRASTYGWYADHVAELSAQATAGRVRDTYLELLERQPA